MEKPATPPNPIRSLFLGGILPLVIFTLVEEYYGTLWGLVVGMAFGVGEIIVEKWRMGKVDTVTWIGNGALLVLGSISLISQEGIWFKLQPALLEFAMAGLFLGSVILGKPFLVMMADKQNLWSRVPEAARPGVRDAFRGFTLRAGIFLLAHAVLATWAAFAWSTRAWMLLKGVGFTGSFIVYAIAESFMMRRRMGRPRI